MVKGKGLIMRRVSLFFAYVFLVSFSVLAQLEGNPENWCRNGFFPRESNSYSVGLVKAKKGERIYFLDDDRKCPNDKNCQRKQYLVNRDQVLVSRSYGDYVCAWYQPRKGGEVVGWLPKNKIEFQNFLSEKYTLWIGEWRYYDNSLKIERIGKTDEFKVSGNALWKGSGANIHVGEIDAVGKLNESVIQLKQDDCQIKLNLIVDYLVVSDNLQCGGLNVSFSGVYRKKTSR